MKFEIHSLIFDKFLGLNIGVVVAKHIDNFGLSEEIMKRIKEKERDIRSAYNTETISQLPPILTWRKAYSSFGAKPKKHKSSVESLYRMVLQGVDLRHINKIVDIYNYASLKHMIPVGGDDMEKVKGDIVLKFARGDEPFMPLNSREVETPREGEVVYVDDEGILCRRWNWRECDRTKMTEDTKDVVLVVEGLPPVEKEDLNKVIEDLSGLIVEQCGGEIKTEILDKNRCFIEI